MIRARSEYKSTCKKQRRGYETKQTKKLLRPKLNNIKEYWKLLSRKGNTINSTIVTIDDFFYHFVSLSNPNGDFYVADDDVISNMNALLNDDLLTCAPRRSIVLQFFWHVDTRPISPFLFFFNSTFYLCIIIVIFLPDVFDTLTEVAGNRTSHFMC